MKATITKIHPLAVGHQFKGEAFYRIEFRTDAGQWAHTDLVPVFRNYARWAPVAVGNTYDGVSFMRNSAVKIDADSNIRRVLSETFGPKPRPKGAEQMPLL